MNAICGARLLHAALVFAAFALQQCFWDGQAAAAGEKAAWGSPTMGVVEKGWDALGRLGSPDKVEYVRAMYLQREFLRRCLSDEDLHQLAGSCASLPARFEDRSRFTNDVLALMVKVYVHSGDWDGLTSLLSTRCPRYLDMWDSIQLYLAQHGRGGKHPVLVLGDAYSKCGVPGVRRDLAVALRRAFAGCGITGKDDADFVKNAMLWYNEEKDRLVVNDAYFDDGPLDDPDYDPGDKGLPWNHSQTLFKKKTAAPAAPGRTPEPGQAGRGAAKSPQATPPAQSAVAQAGESPAGSLGGTWQETGRIRNGNPEGNSLGLYRLAFDMRTGTGAWIGGDGKTLFGFRVTVGSPHEPRSIDLLKTDGWETGVTISAIYELRGDSLRICFPDGNDQWLRPTSFAAEEGSCETLVTLKRLKE
jgi:uncharacterized protein (TIGR03067 family)